MYSRWSLIFVSLGKDSNPEVMSPTRDLWLAGSREKRGLELSAYTVGDRVLPPTNTTRSGGAPQLAMGIRIWVMIPPKTQKSATKTIC